MTIPSTRSRRSTKPTPGTWPCGTTSSPATVIAIAWRQVSNGLARRGFAAWATRTALARPVRGLRAAAYRRSSRSMMPSRSGGVGHAQRDVEVVGPSTVDDRAGAGGDVAPQLALGQVGPVQLVGPAGFPRTPGQGDAR